jgi:hypothetical protein
MENLEYPLPTWFRSILARFDKNSLRIIIVPLINKGFHKEYIALFLEFSIILLSIEYRFIFEDKDIDMAYECWQKFFVEIKKMSQAKQLYPSNKKEVKKIFHFIKSGKFCLTLETIENLLKFEISMAEYRWAPLAENEQILNAQFVYSGISLKYFEPLIDRNTKLK